MAIDEHDREDLLRDGRMMPLRGEATIHGTIVVVGFRSHGQLSLYWGSDPVFQFNAAQQLRRAFVDGQPYAAANAALERLTREKRGGRVEFQRELLSVAAQREILTGLANHLQDLKLAVGASQTTWRVADGEASTFATQLADWLARLKLPVAIAESASV